MNAFQEFAGIELFSFLKGRNGLVNNPKETIAVGSALRILKQMLKTRKKLERVGNERVVISMGSDKAVVLFRVGLGV